MMAATGILANGRGVTSDIEQDQDERHKSARPPGCQQQAVPARPHGFFEIFERRYGMPLQALQVLRGKPAPHQTLRQNRARVTDHDLQRENQQNQPGRNADHRDHRQQRQKQNDDAE